MQPSARPVASIRTCRRPRPWCLVYLVAAARPRTTSLAYQSSSPTATRRSPLPSARNVLRALGGPYPTLAARDSPRVILPQPHVPDNRAPPSPVADYHNHNFPPPFPNIGLLPFQKPNDHTTPPASTPRLIADTTIAGFPRGSGQAIGCSSGVYMYGWPCTCRSSFSA